MFYSIACICVYIISIYVDLTFGSTHINILDSFDDFHLMFAVELYSRELYYFTPNMSAVHFSTCVARKVQLPFYVLTEAFAVTTDPLLFLSSTDGNIYQGQHESPVSGLHLLLYAA